VPADLWRGRLLRPEQLFGNRHLRFWPLHLSSRLCRP
jgi:hypothetical protein